MRLDSEVKLIWHRAQGTGHRAHGAKQLAPPTLAGESRPLRREGTELRA